DRRRRDQTGIRRRASGGPDASGDRAQGALREHRAHRALRRPLRGGELAAPQLPLPASGAAGIHLPLRLARRPYRPLGQPLRAAQSGERLPRLPARHAPHHARRRSTKIVRALSPNYFIRSLTLSRAKRAQSSSKLPPGAPLTPSAPIISLP